LPHSAALYTVRVKEAYHDHRPLGDIDNAGTQLIDVLSDYLPPFESQTDDGSRVVRCLDASTEGDELLITMLHGQSGVVADIMGADRRMRLRQIASDTQLLRSVGIFRLPPTRDLGWLALQVNNGRGIKGLLEVGLYKLFRNDFPELILEIRPFVSGSALREAVDAGKVSKVRLIRYEKPQDRAVAATNNWVRAGELGKIELSVSAPERGRMLKSALLKRFLTNDEARDAAHANIVQFGGILFETAKVEVDVGGRTRTFNLESPTSGHPMTLDLEDLDFDNEGEPTEESLIAGLRDALGNV
jgi:hypothetical protein